MPLDVAELYAQNKRDWASGNETQKNLATLNNQQIREAYGITQDVPLGEVERYIDALKTDNTKKSLITKITNPSVGNNVKASAEAVKNFSYNPANDPAYQSYVDAYTRQGQSAAKQTMANLAAANMGRNSSYGAAATAQVQQAYAKQATDMIPQLAQQAYARLMDKYSIDKDLEDTEYNRAFTGYQTLADDKTRQLTDEQLRLGNIGADINNQAAQIELAYLPTTLRQQVESGEITLDQARLQLALDYKYGEGDRQLAQDQARATISKAYKSGGSSGGKASTKTIDAFIKDFNNWAKTQNYYLDEGIEGDVISSVGGTYNWNNNIGGSRAWAGPLIRYMYSSPNLSAEDINYLSYVMGLDKDGYTTEFSYAIPY